VGRSFCRAMKRLLSARDDLRVFQKSIMVSECSTSKV
jgi:hypothetical protein